MGTTDFPEKKDRPLILVVEDVEEIRDGIELLLKADGYQVVPARTVEDAVLRAKLQAPDLILVSLAGSSPEVIRSARLVREKAELKEAVPVVIFYIEAIAEGEEVGIGHNVFLVRPDNFNQLKALLHRLLSPSPF